jgi:hypothetical protein
MEVDVARFKFLIPRHPMMRPKPGFIEMVCFSSVYLPGQPFPACPALCVEIMQLGFAA